ncbi:MAG: elongation factor 4, partial [Bacilli bacterium]
SVVYKLTLKDGTEVDLQNPSDFPDPTLIASTKEPFARAEIMIPNKYMGTVMTLCQARRGTYIDTQYVDDQRITLIYDMPLSEIIFSFFDKLKSLTAGYASLSYDVTGYQESDLVRMDILLNSEPVDALTMVVFRQTAYARGRAIVNKLKDVIPRQQFKIPVQAVIGGKIIARADIKAVRKDVLAKCYGGDITRKKKLLEAQKQGKKRMKKFGKVSVPQGAFIALLSIDD